MALNREIIQAFSPSRREMGGEQGLGRFQLLFWAFSCMNPFILNPTLWGRSIIILYLQEG